MCFFPFFLSYKMNSHVSANFLSVLFLHSCLYYPFCPMSPFCLVLLCLAFLNRLFQLNLLSQPILPQPWFVAQMLPLHLLACFGSLVIEFFVFGIIVLHSCVYSFLVLLEKQLISFILIPMIHNEKKK